MAVEKAGTSGSPGRLVWGIRGTKIPTMINNSRLPFRFMRNVIAKKSLDEGFHYAKELNRAHPGRKFGVPTKEELRQLNGFLKDIHQLKDRKYWVWTGTEFEKSGGCGTFVLLRLDDEQRSDSSDRAWDDYAVRLIEYR